MTTERAILGRPRSAGRATRPAATADGHRAVRRAHETELAEDYVEVIAELIDATGEARAVDIARQLGVTHVTVTKTIDRLIRAGLVSRRPYRAVFLTPAGARLAETSRRRHELVVQFLMSLGVGETTARADAEGIEHHVSAETLAAFERRVRRASRAR